MPAFVVQAPTRDVSQKVNKVDLAVVFAADAADARAMAQSRFGIDNDTSWAGSTATQVVADADLELWRLRCRIAAPAGEADIVDVTVVGAASETVDGLAALMVTALNATAPIAAAAYVTATNVLTIAAAGDTLGDHTVVLELLPPVVGHDGPVAIPGGVVSLTHEGAAGAALTATLAADAYVVPLIAAVAKVK